MTELNEEGVAHEIDFWKRFVTEERFINGWIPEIRTPDLQDTTYNFIRSNFPSDGKALDVGSGVVSILRGTVPSQSLTAVDPLSELYQKAFDYDKHKIGFPYPYPCEDLPDEWKEKFDLVLISNALDHTVYPDMCIHKLFSCVKPGGHLIIQGFTNEAVHENWQGFHQWNIDVVDGHSLVIKGIDTPERVYTPDHLKVCEKVSLNTGREWFTYITQKV